jgi:hypothetical protein
MGKNKNKKQAANRFTTGRHGGCEALLYAFRDQPAYLDGDDNSVARPLGSHAIHIAAVNFEEAFACLRRERPDFNIDNVLCLGLIEMASGSPVD